jgi:uncharacterized protein YjbI with pentapeptide repeats
VRDSDHIQAAVSCWQQARLLHTDLSESDLPGAVFSQTVLPHARLTGCDLTDTLFIGADLQLRGPHRHSVYTSFHQADCRATVFTVLLRS